MQSVSLSAGRHRLHQDLAAGGGASRYWRYDVSLAGLGLDVIPSRVHQLGLAHTWMDCCHYQRILFAPEGYLLRCRQYSVTSLSIALRFMVSLTDVARHQGGHKYQ